MNSPCKCLQNLNQAFEDVAGVLAALSELCPIPDEELCVAAQAIDRAHAEACRRLGYQVIGDSDDPAGSERPAVVYLVTRIRERSVLAQDASGSLRGCHEPRG
jgi:hypothetical protein